ncbi:3-deoxy-manno-octulosonate cytidylyltransferase [Candidatus Nitromaritima sp. SCGC AAA799-A02]|nr:3-deoxy-manno-octulosonate cytidylyltransferase [Candidatus Nitromaritima sp. SCGC AAA799-A02]
MPADGKVLAVIPARWASTRFPGKPLALISGKPMVEWVAEQAQKARLVSEVVVATDDRRIFDAVGEFGGKAVMTSADHPSGTDRVAEVAENYECDIIVNVQGDEPLIPPENIDLVVRPLLDSSEVPVSTLMIAIQDAEEMFDPNVCKVLVDGDGHALYFSRAPIPYDRDSWSEGIHEAEQHGGKSVNYGYKHIGLYAYTRPFLLQFPKLKVSRLESLEKLEQLRILENGYSIRVMETDKNSIGVDRSEDLDIVERLLNKNN